MAPKVAMKKAIGKVMAKAKVKGKSTKVVGKDKAKAMCAGGHCGHGGGH